MAIRMVLIAAAALAFYAITYGANRETERNLGRQIAQDEGAFCRKVAAGAQYTSCVHDVSQLLQHVQDARAVEF